jgi:hypothetical protein
MPTNSAPAYVIIDRSLGASYVVRSHLLNIGADVHVFASYSAALLLLQRKKIACVLIEFDNDKPTVDFCNAVRRIGVPLVFSASPVAPHDLRQFGFRVNFPQRRESPTIFLPYRSRRRAGVANFIRH